MIENQPPRLEPAAEEDLDESKQKPYFPVVGAIVVGVLVVLVVACFIVIKVLEG